MKWVHAAVLLLALLNACATPRRVHLDTDNGAPLEYLPPTSNKSVEVDAKAFEKALSRLVLNTPEALLFPPQDWLVRASYPSNDADTRWRRLMGKSFTGLCEPGQRRDHCLSLLDDVMGLSPWDKLGIALALSLAPMRQSIAKAVEDTLAPQLFYTVIATGLITWAVLAANPEPVFTKAAAIVSAILLIYLGVETFLEVVDASRELKRATDKATTPEELEQAGQRFANRIGPKVARVFVVAVTVVVSHGMAGGAALLASRFPMLPSFSEAAAVGASQLGINLANVGQVSAVAVVGNTVIISLPATAVAMTAWNGSDDWGNSRAASCVHIWPTHDRCSYPRDWDPRDQIHPMNINDALEDARRRWVEACASSDVGLWWIADDVRQLRPGAPENEIRLETLRALRPLLQQGSLRAAKLLPGGSYQLWGGSIEEQLARIDEEWAALGRPPDIGDIVWFIGAR